MSDTAELPKTPTDHYHLRCLASGEVLHDRRNGEDQFPLSAPGTTGAFLRSEYRSRRFVVGPREEGLFRFSSWLPVVRRLSDSGSPVSYHATSLGHRLGLKNLWVTFSGWWPERGAEIPTGTFKENEAFAVYGRMGSAATRNTLVVASAGNTARAFLRVATTNDLPLVVVVPEQNLRDLWTVGHRGSSTVVVAAGEGSDYSDAISLAGLLCKDPHFLAEGGAKNVARRDGMGTTFLSATHEIGEIPHHYFQAVGSGTGAIAAWEANLRLRADGRFGDRLSRLHLAQNAPFQVLVDSWNARSRDLVLPPDDEVRRQVSEIGAQVLANRRPPWAPVGGLFDALHDTDGHMYAVSNREAAAAAALFAESEGIDVSPAAAVAVGSLVQAVEQGALGADEIVNLNITGGGYLRARQELETFALEPDIVAGSDLFSPERIADAVRNVQTTHIHLA